MSIKAYVGKMGSGKSFEAVSNVILPALAKGRRVITNIGGLNFDAMAELLIKRGSDPESIGQLVTVTSERVESLDFWLTDNTEEPRAVDQMQAGDLVVLDEIWRFFDAFRNPPQPVLNCFRMHRHMVGKGGYTVDFALITQDAMDIGPKVRRVVEQTFQMYKFTAIGLRSFYGIRVFEGAELNKNPKPVRTYKHKYDPDIFPLYSSHTQKTDDSSDPIEEDIDPRGNFLKSPLVRFGLPLGILLAVASGFLFVSWWNSFAESDTQNSSPLPQKSISPAPHQISQPSQPQKEIPKDVLGHYSINSKQFVIVQNEGHLETISRFSLLGVQDGAVFGSSKDGLKFKRVYEYEKNPSSSGSLFGK